LEDIKQGLSKAKDFCLDVWQKVKDAFSTARQFFHDTFQNAWDAVKRTFSAVGSFFEGVWNTIKSKFTSIGTKIGDAVGGAFKSAVNAVISTVERSLNFVPSSINAMLDTINALPGVSISRMGTVSLPRLAKGGIVDRATLAQLGENGREAVIPLERNKQGLREIAGLLAQEMGGGLPGIGGRMQGGTVINLTQNNTSPKALSRYEIYRQTKNMLEAVKLQGAF
jgi:phage-related protein